MAAAGTARTPDADAVVIVMSAVIPGRSVAGGEARSIVTAYDTTDDDELVDSAVGAIAATVPVRSAPIAVTLTSAAWPTLIDATSLSTTSAVTSYVAVSIVI